MRFTGFGRIFSAVFLGLFLLTLIFPAIKIFAQTPDPSTVIKRRAELEAELAELEKQIEVFSGEISSKQTQAKSLERDISLLDAQINKAKLEIRARDIAISGLQSAISEKGEVIVSLDNKIDREKQSLAELLRRLYEIDDASLVEIVLAHDSLSDFFVEADSFDIVQRSLQDSFNEIKENKDSVSKEKDNLEERKAEEVQLKTIQELERKRISEREGEKKKILTTTRNQEKAYKKLVSDRTKDAASIRSQLFALNGSASIPFERALEYAAVAEKAVGIRPAFLLGIITEESNLGANVGTGNWKVDLSHSRCAKQRDVFKSITTKLGLNPDDMPVSKKAWYGYCGGAMGPAQFIPTTWVLYENAVSKITGNSPANPWNPLDAFVASALLLRDNGAGARTYSAEHTAALKYLAGSNWKNPSYRFYGDDVMSFASKYQDQIDILNQVAKR